MGGRDREKLDRAAIVLPHIWLVYGPSGQHVAICFSRTQANIHVNGAWWTTSLRLT